MTAERMQRAYELFEQVLERPPGGNALRSWTKHAGVMPSCERKSSRCWSMTASSDMASANCRYLVADRRNNPESVR